jgi:hypothetical protein
LIHDDVLELKGGKKIRPQSLDVEKLHESSFVLTLTFLGKFRFDFEKIGTLGDISCQDPRLENAESSGVTADDLDLLFAAALPPLIASCSKIFRIFAQECFLD